MSRALAAGLCLIVAVVLLVQGVPRLVSAFSTFPASPVLHKLQMLEEVGDADLRTLVDAQNGGIRWAPSGREYTDMALGQLLLAERLPVGSAERDRLLGESIAALRTGLALAPGNPFAWTRLAQAETLRERGAPEAMAALRLAFDTAPYEPRLMFIRLRIGLVNWKWLGAGDRKLIFRQIRQAWDLKPGRLVDTALDVNRINVVRAALFSNREALAEFEKRLKWQRKLWQEKNRA